MLFDVGSQIGGYRLLVDAMLTIVSGGFNNLMIHVSGDCKLRRGGGAPPWGGGYY